MGYLFFIQNALLSIPVIISCCGILLIPPTLQAQSNQVTFEKFSTLDGIASSTILDIAQDHQGYIWLATEDGLARYDGYDLRTYSNIPGDSSSLSQNRVEKLFVDIKGDIWVGSKSGLDRYNSACDCFFRYSSHASAPANQQAGQINAFAEDKDWNLWIGTQQGGLFRYERKGDRFTRHLDDPASSVNLLSDEVRVLLADRNDRLWIGTGEVFDPASAGGGLVRLDLMTGATKRFRHEPANPNSLIDNRISALLEDRDGKIWVGSCQSGLHYYAPEKEEFVRMMPDSSQTNRFYAPQGEMGLWSSCPHVRFIHQDQRGEFWVGTYNGGIHHFDPVANKLSFYGHDPADAGSLSSNQVWSFLQDRQDRLWIGNMPGGLHKVDPSLHKFKVHSHDPNHEASLSNNHVMGIYEAPTAPGKVWLGTRGGGLNSLDLETGLFESFRHKPRDRHSIRSDIVWTTFEDRSGTFWVGTEAGLDTLDRRTGRFSGFKLMESMNTRPATDPIIRIHEDREGRLWLGTWSGGLLRLSRDRAKVKRYVFSTGSQQTFYNSVYALHEDMNGTLWAGVFQGGLFEYDAGSDSFLPHLEAFGATSMLEDSPGIFWVGTINNGLLHYNAASRSLRQFTKKDGLSSNIVVGMLRDENNVIWLSTGNGVARFDPKTGRFTNYGLSDGLPFTSFNHTSAFETLGGQLLFGGVGGLVSFFPDEVRGNPHPPEVVLSGLQIAGAPFALGHRPGKSSLPVTLNHRQNDITFDYVGLHFTRPSKNTYKYRLQPYDSDWIDAGTQRTARYTNLDPGDYTFQVIARNSDGIWNEAGASLRLHIIPPWWTRWWAYASFMAILVGAGWWFYRFQLSRKLALAESTRLQEIDHLKSSLYTNITHEFRTPLTVILGMADNLQSKAKDQYWREARQPLEMIRRNGKGLLRLVNEMLSLAKLESGHVSLELQQEDAVAFIRYRCESFQSLAQEKSISLTIHAGSERLMMDFDAAKLASIVSNLLSNALKFTPSGGKITVGLNKVFLQGQEHLSIKVKDTGKGLHKEEIAHVFDRFYQAEQSPVRQTEGTGIGLALTRELVALMQGSIAVRSVPGRGSEFEVILPITTQAPTVSALTGTSEVLPAAMPFAGECGSVKAQALHLPLLLIIEDNPDVANYLKVALENKYHCQHAPNGAIGIEKAFRLIPDLVICDVMMPVMDGFAVCAALKSDLRTDHIPVVMLTARVGLKDRLTGLSRGADAYLAKPFEREELLIRLEKLLEVRHRLQQKYSKGIVSSAEGNTPPPNPMESFLVKAEGVIFAHLEEEDFSVDHLAEALCLSRSQVHRKVKALTGQSTSIYVRLVRLQKAKELLADQELTISEVAYRVGFKSPVYFSQIFRKTFGESPTESRK